MNATEQSLSRLAIPAEKKTRRRAGPLVMLVIVLLLLAGALAVFFNTQQNDRKPIPATTPASAPAPKTGDSLLTVSGYIIPRERIELSPRFMATVKWIGVKKGDCVKKGDLIVQLEDDEFKARMLEVEGRLALAQANLTNAELNLSRQLALDKAKVESQRALDEARRARDVAAAELTVAKGQLALAKTYVEWCKIFAPVDGVILEKLAEANELVVPQSFGGGRGPSTALVSLADLNDLQVEIDINEADLSKVRLKQRCRIAPEAYPDKKYGGYVAEIAPEANRSKGTLQVKVQVEKPDAFLTPELTAKVEFLADKP
jgi:HlyD family secretion protein